MDMTCHDKKLGFTKKYIYFNNVTADTRPLNTKLNSGELNCQDQ